MTVNKTKLILIIAGIIVLTFVGNFLFAKKFIEPKIVDDAVKRMQQNIDEDYNNRMDNINSQMRVLDGRINVVEKKRKEVERQVAELKKIREAYKPPVNLNEAVKALQGRGYEVIIR